MEDCVFCKIIRREIEAKIIDESENFIAFLDANPKVNNHTLIVPKEHFITILDLPDNLAIEMLNFIKKVVNKYLKEGAEGFNIIINNGRAAGQIINHLHLHILPRKEGDGFRVSV